MHFEGDLLTKYGDKDQSKKSPLRVSAHNLFSGHFLVVSK